MCKNLVKLSNKLARKFHQDSAMAGKALRLKTELEIHAVSCPGVFFPAKVVIK